MSEWIKDKAIAVVATVVLLLVVSFLANGLLDVADWLDGDTVQNGEPVVRELVEELDRQERE